MFREQNVLQINSEGHSSSWFKVLGDKAYLVEQDALFIVQDAKKLVKTYAGNDLNITKSHNCLLVGNSALGYDLIHPDESITYEQKLKGFKLPFDSRSGKIYFFRRDRKSKEYQSGLYDTETCSFLLDKDLILNITFIDDDVYITAENIRIDNEGNALWKLHIEQFGNVEIREILNVYRNQLLVACSEHLLLSVDVNTGKILRKWKELPGFEAGQFYKDVLPEPTNFVLDKSKAKLIGVFDTYYFEIDIVSGEINYYQLKDELSRYGITDFRPFNNNPFTPEHLFLTGHTFLEEIPNVDLSSVLALNRNTKKVDWVHIFKETGLGTNVPQITSTHLYQLDTEKNLYIFERIS